MSMLWAQIFPFVVLQLYDGDADTKDALTVYLVGSFSLWVLLNVAFFATIDRPPIFGNFLRNADRAVVHVRALSYRRRR